jgi:hypothetical protein
MKKVINVKMRMWKLEIVRRINDDKIDLMFDYELKSMSVDYLKRTHHCKQKNYAVHENIESYKS